MKQETFIGEEVVLESKKVEKGGEFGWRQSVESLNRKGVEAVVEAPEVDVSEPCPFGTWTFINK